MLNYLKKRYLPFNFNMLMENIQKCIFFLIFHLAHFFCSRVYMLVTDEVGEFFVVVFVRLNDSSYRY